ncbi:MAG: hypothetical protein QOD06_100 [Candidatus Binatota bacterium]|nr:hypothetical protein [Candidatus Binatota bacterium]
MTPDARARAGLAALRARGIDPETAEITELEGAAAAGGDAAFAVAEALASRPSDASAAALRRLENEARGHSDKALRREVRRALYRLARKGIDAAADPPAEKAPRPAAADPRAEGFLSLADAAGDRLMWIVKPRSGGGLFHLNAIVNEPAGLREIVVGEVNRKQLRELRSDLERRHRLRLVDVDWRYVDWIAHEGYDRARTRGALAESVAAYPTLRLQLFATSAAPQPPPIESVLDAAAVRADASALASSADLFEAEELAWWFLPEAEFRPVLDRYHELRDSPIVLDRVSQQHRIAEALEAGTVEIFSGEHAAAWRRRLEELAYVLWKTDLREDARRAYAAALALAESTSGGRGIPFLEELVRRSFDFFVAREAEREREQKAGSVLLTPDELRQQQARARAAAPTPQRLIRR